MAGMATLILRLQNKYEAGYGGFGTPVAIVEIRAVVAPAGICSAEFDLLQTIEDTRH
jgi:hypothetical protein